MYCNLMYILPQQQKQFTFYTRTLNSQGIPDPSLDPNNLCHHYDALVLKGNDDSIGDFSLDEEYGGTTTTHLAPQAVVY